jgi:cytochrome c5
VIQFYGFLLLILSNLSWGSSHHPQEFLASLKHDPKAAEKIYQQYCANCHALDPLIPLGAPRLGDKAAWQGRLRKGDAILLKHSLNGIGLMPARGGCFECSDEQIKMVINYMINHK